MKTFWQLLRDSVILQSLMVMMVMGSVCFLAITGKPIPEVMVNVTMLIAGFFFGAKSITAVQSATRDAMEVVTQTLVTKDKLS